MKKILLAIIVVLGMLAVSHHALAAPGDIIKQVPKIKLNTNGILFDGQHIRISYIPIFGSGDPFGEIITVDENAGTALSSICLHEPSHPCGSIYTGGIAWDSTRKTIWAVVSYDSGNTFQIKSYDPNSGAVLQTCGVPPKNTGDYFGLEYDGSTDTLWFDSDQPVSYHLSLNCQIIETVSSPGVATESTAFDSDTACYYRSYSNPADPLSDGVNDNLLAQQNQNGSSTKWKTKTVISEDNAYENANRWGVPVVWIINDGNDTITAFEIPLTRCDGQLAVTWAWYKAQYTGNGSVDVTWMTTSETNTVGFFVERSGSATGTFTVISPFIFAQGPGMPYEWFDLNPLPGDNWYRIQEITTNGPGDMTEPFEAQPAIIQPPILLQGATTVIMIAAAERGTWPMQHQVLDHILGM